MCNTKKKMAILKGIIDKEKRDGKGGKGSKVLAKAGKVAEATIKAGKATGKIASKVAAKAAGKGKFLSAKMPSLKSIPNRVFGNELKGAIKTASAFSKSAKAANAAKAAAAMAGANAAVGSGLVLGGAATLAATPALYGTYKYVKDRGAEQESLKMVGELAEKRRQQIIAKRKAKSQSTPPAGSKLTVPKGYR